MVARIPNKFFPLWQKILLSIDGVKSIADITKDISGTYSQVSLNITHILEKDKLVNKKRIGRKSLLTLTPRGETVRNGLNLLITPPEEPDST